MNELKKKISAQVPMAVAVVSDNRKAFVQRVTAEGEMIRELVELVKPTLPAICNSYAIPGWGVLQGLAIPKSDLYLDIDGQVVRPFGKGSSDRLSWREVAEVVDVGALAEQLSDVLDRMINGSKSLRTEQANARARKLRALVVLLQEL